MCFWYKISYITLLPVKRTYTNLEMFYNFMPAIIWNFSFSSLHIFDNDASSWKYQYFCLKRKFYWKNTSSQNWKLTNGTFWPKQNRSSFHKKLFSLELWHNPLATFVLKLWWRLWRLKRNESIKVCRRLGRITNLFCLLNRGQKFWTNIKKSNKTERDEKTLIPVFA